MIEPLVETKGPEPRCLTDEQLEAFHFGRVADVETAERFSDHLGACDQCNSRLTSLADHEDPIAELLRAPNPLIEFSSSLRASGDTTASFGSREDAQSVTIPEKIGRYFVIEGVSRGGFGRVYKAKDPVRDRIVAIKTPRRPGERTNSLFLKEARTAAKLNHPSIVRVYDWGRENGSCFVVMEMIEGKSLREYLKASPKPAKVAKLLAQVADALHYAHLQGVYHRDIKPENILIDNNGKPYLTDFGLAICEQDRWKRDGDRAGTYAYMAPEQVRRDSQYVDGRADVWGLGVVLYEALAGERPFTGETQSTVWDEIQNREPRSLKAVDGLIPQYLDDVCRNCLQKDVGERYATAAKLASDLRWRSRFYSFSAAIVLSLLLCAGASLALWSPKEDAAGPEVNSSEAAPFDRWIILFDHEPVAIARNATVDSNAWKLYPKERFHVMSGTDVAVAQFGETRRRIFHFQSELHIENWIGYSGLVFGLHDLETVRPGKWKRCYAVRVGRDSRRKPLTVEVQRFDLKVLAGGGYDVTDTERMGKNRDLRPPEDSLTVSFTVENNRLADLRVDGDPIQLDREPRFEWPADPACGYGVTSVGAYCVFQSAEIMFKESLQK